MPLNRRRSTSYDRVQFKVVLSTYSSRLTFRSSHSRRLSQDRKYSLEWLSSSRAVGDSSKSLGSRESSSLIREKSGIPSGPFLLARFYRLIPSTFLVVGPLQFDDRCRYRRHRRDDDSPTMGTAASRSRGSRLLIPRRREQIETHFLHTQSRVLQESPSRRTPSSSHQRCSAQHSRRPHRVRMGARHRDHYYGGLLTRSSDTKPRRQPRPTETESSSRRDARHTRIRGAITASCNRNAIGMDGNPRPKSGNSLTSVLGMIPSPRCCESRRRSNAPEGESRDLFPRHTR